MVIIKVTNINQIEIIVELASLIWHEHFTPIIGKAQVNYMLEKFQSKEAITQQINTQFNYYLLMKNNKAIGYVGIIIKDHELFLSKFYVLLEQRNKGIGKQVMTYLEQLSIEHGINKITLTVNKNNIDVIRVYKKLGFIKLGVVIQDIGGGFVMDDYKLEKTL